MAALSVYKELTQGTGECLAVMRREIGLKTTCKPFALKLLTALSDLKPQTQQDELKVINTLMSGLQTLMQGGVTAEDYDKIDFVVRGGTLVPSARVEAFYRACARKGYRVCDTIVAVPKEDDSTTYFKENFYNGDIVYTLEDLRKNPDRAVTAERLVSGYFSKFLCRLDVHELKSNKRIAMTAIEMPTAEVLEVAAVSEQGLYKSKWEEYNTRYGVKKRKVITDELNSPTAFWIRWTGEMVNKTVIRRALKRLKEALPELTDSIYAFESDEYIEQAAKETPRPELVIPMSEPENAVDLKNLTPDEAAECKEMLELFKVNPRLAEDKFIEITESLRTEDKQEVINREYAAISALCLSPQKRKALEEYL